MTDFDEDGVPFYGPMPAPSAPIRLPEPGDPSVEFDWLALSEAFVRWKRGDKREALYLLEKAVDGHLHGLGDLKPEDLH